MADLWLINIARFGHRFRFWFGLQTKWLHCTMQNFSYCKDSDSHPNCQIQKWDRNLNHNRNPNLWMWTSCYVSQTSLRCEAFVTHLPATVLIGTFILGSNNLWSCIWWLLLHSVNWDIDICTLSHLLRQNFPPVILLLWKLWWSPFRGIFHAATYSVSVIYKIFLDLSLLHDFAIFLKFVMSYIIFMIRFSRL